MCGWKAIREQFLKQTMLQEVRIVQANRSLVDCFKTDANI